MKALLIKQTELKADKALTGIMLNAFCTTYYLTLIIINNTRNKTVRCAAEGTEAMKIQLQKNFT